MEGCSGLGVMSKFGTINTTPLSCLPVPEAGLKEGSEWEGNEEMW